MYEREYWREACFVTLTYDDEHLPPSESQYFQGTLKPSDSTLFWKNLRKDLTSPIKYYLCGEYGDKHHRSHMHAIIFGLNDSEQSKELLYENWRKCDYGYWYKNKTVGSATHDSMQYVAGYCQKKLYDDMKLYEKENVIAPFSRSSQGLGTRYLLDNLDLIEKQGLLNVKGLNVPVPKYFVDKYPDNPVLQRLKWESCQRGYEKLSEKYGEELIKRLIALRVPLDLDSIDLKETVIRNREKRFGGNCASL